MLRPERNQKIGEFSRSENYHSVLLTAALFVCGLLIVINHGLLLILSYVGLWIASYGIIYAGTCRYCAYYGKSCPVPLEGSCVHYFFKKSEKPFGYMQLVWATVVYALRVVLPVLIIFKTRSYGWGAAYFFIFIIFWITHLRFSGCPNCVNTRCPLNPDY